MKVMNDDTISAKKAGAILHYRPAYLWQLCAPEAELPVGNGGTQKFYSRKKIEAIAADRERHRKRAKTHKGGEPIPGVKYVSIGEAIKITGMTDNTLRLRLREFMVRLKGKSGRMTAHYPEDVVVGLRRLGGPVKVQTRDDVAEKTFRGSKCHHPECNEPVCTGEYVCKKHKQWYEDLKNYMSGGIDEL